MKRGETIHRQNTCIMKTGKCSFFTWGPGTRARQSQVDEKSAKRLQSQETRLPGLCWDKQVPQGRTRHLSSGPGRTTPRGGPHRDSRDTCGRPRRGRVTPRECPVPVSGLPPSTRSGRQATSFKNKDSKLKLHHLTRRAKVKTRWVREWDMNSFLLLQTPCRTLANGDVHQRAGETSSHCFINLLQCVSS